MNDREYMQPKGEPNIVHSQLPLSDSDWFKPESEDAYRRDIFGYWRNRTAR
jgi:hypothetical protein